MSVPSRIFFTLILAVLATSLGAAPQRTGDFTLIDHQGDAHQLRKYGFQNAVVLVSHATECSENIEMLPRYKILRSTWEDDGVSVLMLNASTGDSLDAIQSQAQLYRIDMPILLDETQLVAENLGLRTAGEVVVIDPGNLHILYRGPLDDVATSSDDVGASGDEEIPTPMADAIRLAVSGNTDELETQVADIHPASGCELQFPTREQHAADPPDYAEDVAPILEQRCTGCHIEGGIAPFAMDSHQMVQGWGPMMREVLMTRRMPPAQVDPHIREFTNARNMPLEETRTLVHWLEAGAPRGDSEIDPLAQIEPPASEWNFGEPDYIVEVPTFDVPATGVLDYQNQSIPLPFTEEKWIQSIQFIPGDRRVLHHLLSYITPAEFEREVDEAEDAAGFEFLEGYAPGKEGGATFPPNSGVKVPRGSALQLSIHYTTFGQETVDNTRVGLWFTEDTPNWEYQTQPVSPGNRSRNIMIPPGKRHHEMEAAYVFDKDVILHGLRPHMHYRGKSMRFSVIYPDDIREDILNVPDYNFAWQPTYRLAEPMRLPAGSRVVINGAFDNSEYNPGNPDPDSVARGGLQSWEEMFIGYFSYHDAEERSEQQKPPQ